MFVLGKALNGIKSGRAGVIPYIYDKGTDELFFLLGLDKKAKELTDFGGGVKNGETALMAACREFQEESRSLFDERYYNINNYIKYISLSDNEMSILFLPVGKRWFDQAKISFEKNESIKKTDEMSIVEWHNLDSFCDLSFNPKKTKMWRKVQKFLITNIGEVRRLDFIDMLKFMYDE